MAKLGSKMPRRKPLSKPPLVGTTILEQLGGQRFLVMTGAKQLVGLPKGLQFGLPSLGTKDGINKVRITLTPNDTYDIDFFKIRGTKIEKKGAVNGVHVDELRQVFTSRTGLETSLGTLGR